MEGIQGAALVIGEEIVSDLTMGGEIVGKPRRRKDTCPEELKVQRTKERL